MHSRIMQKLQSSGIYFLDKKLQPMASINAQDVAIMMILLKVSRSNQGKKFNLDNFVDMAGYSAIAGEIGDSGSF